MATLSQEQKELFAKQFDDEIANSEKLAKEQNYDAADIADMYSLVIKKLQDRIANLKKAN